MCEPLWRRKAGFFAMLLITMTPILLFPFLSWRYHEVHQLPRVQAGVLDLTGYDLNRDDIPLDGQWQFYWNKRLVTQQLPRSNPDAMARVPAPWTKIRQFEPALPQEGYASYRLLIRGQPNDVQVICYVPNIGVAYRAFLDGKQICSSGTLSSSHTEFDVSLTLERTPQKLLSGQEHELVLEVESTHIGGLHITPILAEGRKNASYYGFRYMVALVFCGMLLIMIGCMAYILLSKHNSFHSLALLVLDILVFMRILGKDEFFGMLKQVAPMFSYVPINMVLSVVTLVLPVCFLICARDLVCIRIKKKVIRNIVYFELFCFPIMFMLHLSGRVKWGNLICFLSFSPFVYILVELYRNVKRGVPYSNVVAMGMMFSLSSLIVANQAAVGDFVMNVSLYPSTCFVISMLTQVYMYINISAKQSQDALEAANLRLRLQESETELMLSQIKPHFLYNSLTAIQVLCTREPETAAEAIMRFSKFLRANMQAINSKEPVAFTQELEHVRNYVAIEELRFRGRLTMRYEIGPKEFALPPLTVQPLVENAIKHGVCKNALGGWVMIRTYEEPQFWCVEIEDNGPGFDTSILETGKEDSFGLKNISLRLKQRMQAELLITSTPGQGVCARIRLPKQEGQT